MSSLCLWNWTNKKCDRHLKNRAAESVRAFHSDRNVRPTLDFDYLNLHGADSVRGRVLQIVSFFNKTFRSKMEQRTIAHQLCGLSQRHPCVLHQSESLWDAYGADCKDLTDNCTFAHLR